MNPGDGEVDVVMIEAAAGVPCREEESDVHAVGATATPCCADLPSISGWLVMLRFVPPGGNRCFCVLSLGPSLGRERDSAVLAQRLVLGLRLPQSRHSRAEADAFVNSGDADEYDRGVAGSCQSWRSSSAAGVSAASGACDEMDLRRGTGEALSFRDASPLASR